MKTYILARKQLININIIILLNYCSLFAVEDTNLRFEKTIENYQAKATDEIKSLYPLQTLVESTFHTVICKNEKNQKLGFIEYIKYHYSAGTQYAYLAMIEVENEHRKKGYFSKLLKYWEEDTLGFTRDLYCFSINPDAASIYQSKGYKLGAEAEAELQEQGCNKENFLKDCRGRGATMEKFTSPLLTRSS